ncbi:serine/threonine-protein kinase tefu isoform X2 [Megachile rotundata]|uniref:serine/threonine-protein kinase tefu isoform X2 n=1 Tax=Megachile rotundata TaxID=143995 RepID=UPI0006150DF4|nr:PREDICTED: serine-protein kinase ATM isoform X2 [Megachile rotundata]
MSKYLERIYEILNNASSKKVTDKRKCVHDLLNLYENQEAIDEIHKNTEQNTDDVVNWSYIIHIVHKIVLNETERLAHKDNYSKAIIIERQNTCALVQKTFHHATYKKPLLKCKDIMPLIFQILGTDIYEYYHDTYMNILVSYILPCRKYQVEMLSANWEELLKICMNLYKYASLPTNKRIILNALQMIVNYGCLYSSLCLNVNEILIFLENMFVDAKANQEMLTECSYKFAHTICCQIATEYRSTLCHFRTNNICDGAYANNWETWYTILENIYLMILKDFKADTLSESFIYLSREVFKQVIDNSNVIKEEVNEYNYMQPTKRRRITKVNGPIDMLMDSNSDEAWPIIQILKVLFKQYPECLKSQDLPTCTKSIVDLLAQFSKEETIVDDLYELAAVLLINEKLFSPVDIENSNIYWDKIWDTLLRSLNISQNEISSHKLTQLFIMNNKITNPNILLKLYFTNVIKWSVMSLRTLIVLCEYLPLPDDIAMCNINVCSPVMNSNSVRSCLIKWALNIPWYKMAMQIVIDELCLFLIGITLKSKHKKQVKFNEYNMNNSCDCLKTEENTELFNQYIEQCYLSLTYKQNLLTEVEDEDIQYNLTTNEHVLCMQDILTYLTNSLCDVINESKGNDDLYVIIIKIAIIAKVVSMMKQLNLIPNDMEELSLISIMKKYLDIAYTLLEKMDPLKSKYIYLCNVTKALNILYGTLYDMDVAKIIVSSTTSDMLKKIFSLMNIEDHEITDYKAVNDCYDDYGSFQNRRKCLGNEVMRKKQCNYCNRGTIRIQATKALSLFCCTNVGQEKFEIQIKLMSNLLKIDMYDLSQTVDFKMAIIVLKHLSKYDKKEIWKHFRRLPLKNLLKLYDECYNDETAVRYILNNLPFFFEYAVNYDCELQNLMNIIFQFNNVECKKKYGFFAHIEFIRCLSRIIHTNSTRFDYKVCDDSNQMPIFKLVLSALNNYPFVVRLQVINCIKEIYSSNTIDLKWKEALFKQIEEYVSKLIIGVEMNEKMKLDERETKIASTLLMLTTIIYTNGIFQCRALLTMLRFVTDNKIDIQLIPKAINTAANRINYSNLIDDNLSYVLTYWFTSKYSSESFPWKLTECKSEEQFNKTYINTLVFIKFQNLELSDIISFCIDINIPFEQIIENSFPKILAWLLYCISGNNGSTSKKLANKIFHSMISNQNEFIQVTKFSTLFNNKFEKTLLYLIERLHDENYLEEMLEVKVSFAPSDPPHFKEEVINACLRYMKQNFFTQQVSIQYVLAHNCPNILQNMLLHLIGNIYNKKFVEYKIKAFHQYIFFCTLIAEELQLDYFNTLSMYVIKDISCSLLHMIKEQNDILVELACKYFYKFIKLVLPTRSEEIKEILDFTVMVLVPIAETEKVPIALEILKFLLIDHKEALGDAIKKLNSFPNISIFEEIRHIHNDLKCKNEKVFSLKEEIQHFLNVMVDKDINCNIDDIIHLRIQLSTRKQELQELYSKFEKFRGFAEDCASSILHQLIYKLIKLTASSVVNISIEAAKCLGELGPADLMSMILYLQKSHAKETSDLMEILSYKIVIAMIKCLFQSDIELRKVSANALYVIFSSSWGQKLLNIKYMEHLKTVLNESQVTLPVKYIQPFVSSKSSKSNNINLNYATVNDVINPHNDIWTVHTNNSYNNWIVKITSRIIECFNGFYFENLISVCTLSTDFCEIILPRIIFLIIHIDKKFTSTICSCIDQFFNYHFNVIIKANVSSYAIHKVTSCDQRIVRSMLNIVNYIRIQVVDNLSKLNYICIAKAAQYCSAFFTAILYAEMSCETMLNDYENSINVSKIDYIYELSPEEGKVIQNILRDSYTKIGDFDAISGTGSSHLQDHSTRIQHYIYTNEWNQVMLTQDVELSFGNMTAMREMANGLHQSGLQYLLSHFISTMSKEDENIDKDIEYECAWRLSNWNLHEPNQALHTQNNCNFKPEITEYNYYFYHYQALKYFHENNERGVQNAIQNARSSIIKALRNTSLESSKTIYEKLMQLQLISEIEELCIAKEDEYEEVLRKWQQQDITNFNEFQYIEPILFQRTVMYQINRSLINNSQIKTALANTYLQISEIAADKENLHIATRSLAMLAKQKDLSPKIEDQLLYQESLLARLRKDLELGRFLLRNLMHKDTLDVNLRAQILRVYGDWMAETKSENPQAVIKNYYLKSIDASNSIREHTADTIKNLHDTYVALARFADNQFEQISSYMKSPQFESLRECIIYSYKGIPKHTLSDDKDVRSAMILNQRQNTNDVAELEHIEKEKNNYLTLALKYYLITLQQSEDHNLLVFRIIALWLDNMSQKEVNDLLDANLNKIPSFKFVPLLPQLAVHLNDDFTEFSKKIYKIMERCALEHPHHTLPVLLALKNLYGDYDYNTSRKSKTLEPRVLGAQKLLQELTKTNINSIIHEMENVSHSLVMLANLPTSTNKAGTIVKIPRDQRILRIKNFQNVFVPTLTIDVNPSGNYNDIIGISKYVETYETVGGVNTPKKLTCVGMDGIVRHQLVKGRDDLRQDAVMQQVFNVMNTLLRACKETKRRKLTIRTYKVVPLTQRSGVLEWCDNTMPIISVLIGSRNIPGLHKKYYPKDYTAEQCKDKLAAIVKSSTDTKLKVFMDCCAHMHPVMHYFFTEKYPSPETWFERRLAYTRSIATTSMAGYILGLGDRHLNNILIDQTTAEVIHIDFGIAFEQGKVLPVPETIPFRLTRNIEAGMGVSGVEGTMRHCCEKTLTVLRDQRQIIITLLQVLLYDPLFKWTITPAKAHDIQSGTSSRPIENNQSSTGINKPAERSLLRIEQKLQGTEEGLASSVSGQVERLIQQARDPINLCRLYFGWQPYL